MVDKIVFELPHIVRFISAYEKKEDGYLVQDYKLKPIPIEKLDQSLI